MSIPRSFPCALLASITLSVGYGQVASRVSGTIRDTTDAVMPRVNVMLEDVDKGTTEAALTNEAGRYSFPTVKVGTYRVSAEAPGFKKSTTESFPVNVNQTVEMDFRMEVGQVAEKIEVSALAAILQTSDSQVGNLIDTRTVVDLPLAARDFMQLSLISPGVSDNGGNSRHQTERASWVGSFSVHGHDPTYNQYLFDGVTGKEASHQTNIFAPSVDAIQEIKIETANYSAEFGSEAGGHINVVTRSGSNQIHGVLYEFLRNDKMDARDSFADRKSKLRRNTFGGTIGGPFLKDKTFYFFSWESMRLRQGFTQNTTVPDAKMKGGDFSALLNTDSSLRTPIVLYDWTTGAPFPGNIIPKDRQSRCLSTSSMNSYRCRTGLGAVPSCLWITINLSSRRRRETINSSAEWTTIWEATTGSMGAISSPISQPSARRSGLRSVITRTCADSSRWLTGHTRLARR